MYTSDNLQYVSGRLHGTAIRHVRDGLVFVGNVGYGRDGLMVSYCDLAQRTSYKKDKLERFNLISPPLGYSNVDGEAFYISRIPKRNDWRQGIRKENLVTLRQGQPRQYCFDNLVPVLIPIEGRYPKYSEVMERIEDIYTSCAFSKRFSLDDQARLWYKGSMKVGTGGGGTPNLHEQYVYLTEALQEDLGNQHET